MSAVYEEFIREMETVQRRSKGDLRKELISLLLIALEREELVTVSYRESLMAGRLDEMPLPEDVRKLIRHALIWIWKDEDMHTLFTRGALMRIGGRWLRFKALASQATGALAGWAASVVQHVRFSRSPFGWATARIVAGIGRVTGKVPKEVRRHVRYSSFRAFCQFNIDAELTAEVCWVRIVELARQMPEFSPAQLNDLERVAFDEDRHGKIFRIIMDALDDENRLVPGVTSEQLVQQIGEVSEYFLPREFRQLDPELHPIGTGGKIISLAAEDEEDKATAFSRALDTSDLRERLERVCTRQQLPPEDLQVAIKVAFIMGTHRQDTSPVTDPHNLEQLCRWLRANGFHKITVLESDNIYDHFFQNREAETVGRYFGFGSDQYELRNISRDLEQHRYTRGMGAYAISRDWKNAHFRISLSKLRSHPTELAMLGLGNLEWMGSRVEEFIFLDRQADRHTALMMLLDDFPPHYSILDGFDNCPDGLVGMMGCRNPKSPRRFYLGKDALAVDTVAAKHLGLKALPATGLLNTARHWFGGWSQDVEIIGTDKPISEWRNPVDNRLWALLSLLSFPMYALFSNRGSYFVAEMDEAAFPPKEKTGRMTRFLRKLNRRIIGLHFGGKARK